MLPDHGKIACAECHRGQPFAFDRTQTVDGGWRITSNPLAWGNSTAEIVVLGFSKGPTQSGSLGAAAHDEIAYRGGRTALAKILHHIRLIEAPNASVVDSLISDCEGRFHFGSLIRCTVERREEASGLWKGTGGGMLDKFVANKFGTAVLDTCMEKHLGDLPKRTKLVVMLGMGTDGNYVAACRSAFRRLRPGEWRSLNEVAYSDGTLTVVHTEHFKSQGALLPNWLSEDGHPRGQFGLLARQAVELSGVVTV